jgi:hypothetical protein
VATIVNKHATAVARIDDFMRVLVSIAVTFVLRSPGIYAWEFETKDNQISPLERAFSRRPPALALVVALPIVFANLDSLQDVGHMPNAMMFLLVVDVPIDLFDVSFADR